MDETLSRVALDISGRPFTVWKAEFSQKRLGDFDTELFEHWFQSFAQAAGITLHVETLHGRNNRSEEHTSELQSLMRISYAVFCLKKKKYNKKKSTEHTQQITNIKQYNYRK